MTSDGIFRCEQEGGKAQSRFNPPPPAHLTPSPLTPPHSSLLAPQSRLLNGARTYHWPILPLVFYEGSTGRSRKDWNAGGNGPGWGKGQEGNPSEEWSLEPELELGVNSNCNWNFERFWWPSLPAGNDKRREVRLGIGESRPPQVHKRHLGIEMYAGVCVCRGLASLFFEQKVLECLGEKHRKCWESLYSLLDTTGGFGEKQTVGVRNLLPSSSQRLIFRACETGKVLSYSYVSLPSRRGGQSRIFLLLSPVRKPILPLPHETITLIRSSFLEYRVSVLEALGSNQFPWLKPLLYLNIACDPISSAYLPYFLPPIHFVFIGFALRMRNPWGGRDSRHDIGYRAVKGKSNPSLERS